MTSSSRSDTTLSDFITPGSLRVVSRLRTPTGSPEISGPPCKSIKLTSVTGPEMINCAPTQIDRNSERRFLTVSDTDVFVELVTAGLDFGITEWNDRPTLLLEAT